MINVILDTNAVLFPFTFQVSLEDEIRQLVGGCRIFVPKVVREELEGLKKRGNRNAGAALRYAERFDISSERVSIHDGRKEMETGDGLKDGTRGGNKGMIGGKGDTAILAAAIELDAILVTSDRGLIARAKEKGLKVIFLRGKQKLELK